MIQRPGSAASARLPQLAVKGVQLRHELQHRDLFVTQHRDVSVTTAREQSVSVHWRVHQRRVACSGHGLPDSPLHNQGMTSAHGALAERIRELLAEESDLREVSMFGGRAFMVNGKLAVSAQKDGSMLVRVAAENHDEILRRAGVTQAEMGAGRGMGPGWVSVSAETVAGAEGTASWVATAMEHNRSVAG